MAPIRMAVNLSGRQLADEGLPETVWPPALVRGLVADAKEQGLGPEAFATVPGSPAQRASPTG